MNVRTIGLVAATLLGIGNTVQAHEAEGHEGHEGIVTLHCGY